MNTADRTFLPKNEISFASVANQGRRRVICGVIGLLLLAPFVLCTPSFAREYTVAKTAGASDDNLGTADSPLRTIGAAVSKAGPGDVVTVLPGDYRSENTGYGVGVIPIMKSGTLTKPIRVQAGGDGDVTVRTFLVANCRDVIIEGFQVRGLDLSTVSGWRPMPSVVRTPNPELPRPDYGQPFETREAQIRSEFAVYFSVIDQLDFSSGIDLENCRRIFVIENDVAGYFAGVQCRGCIQIDILDNKIRDCVNGIFTFYANDGTTPGVISALIQGNDIQQSLDNGLDIRAESKAVWIYENQVSLSGRSHISLQDGAHRCRVESNRVRHGGYYSETMKFPGSSAISLNDAGDRNLVLNNHVVLQRDLTGIDGNGIIVDFMREGTLAVIDGNISANNAGAGLNLTASPGMVIRNNYFCFNGRFGTEFRRGAGIKISRDNDIDNFIVDNVLIANRAAGILSSGTITSQSLVDRNTYIIEDEPLIWDAYNPGDSEYQSLDEVQAFTGWERLGEVWFR